MLIGVFGKGGVGKTTVSLGLGLLIGKATIITTDPYPGLKELLPDPPPGLRLVEMSYEELREEWKKEFGAEALSIFKALAEVDEEFIDYLSTAPGLIEQYAVYRVMKEGMASPNETVIWDTQGAPGVMSLIRSELEFYDHLRKAPIYWAKIKKLLTRDVNLEKIIEHWKQIAQTTINYLRRTKTIVIVNPDKLSIKIGRTLAQELSQYTEFKGYIINRSSQDKKITAQLSPIISVIPELNEPSPHAVTKYLVDITKIFE